MSTRLGRFARDYCRPGMWVALTKVALIGTWRGRTFLDDDVDLGDFEVPDVLTADVAPVVTVSAPNDAPPSDAAPGGSHPVAA